MTDTANLEDGFYWVRRFSDWIVAEYKHSSFWLASDQLEYPEAWFHEIDPRPIKREE